jgi:uncharacterized protein (TIGR02270 family)
VSSRATFIVDVFDEHVDELGFLFGQWRAALRSPEYTLRAVGHLEERIRGHLQGTQVPGEAARPRLFASLEGDDADLIFSAAYSLLHSKSPDATEKVLEAFATLEGDAFQALTVAMAYGPLPPGALERLRAMLSARPATRAMAAAEVLAFHRGLQLTGDQLRYFLEDEDVAVRLLGWRMSALLGTPLASTIYSGAVRDGEPTVALAALEAGAWCGVPGVPAVLRQLNDPARPDRLQLLHLLAVLGASEDTQRIQAALSDASLGPVRFMLAPASGSPVLMPIVFGALEDPDAATAAEAGAAFARLTGVGIDSDVRAGISAGGEEPDAFAAEFMEEVNLPDAARARREWERLRPRLEAAKRLNRGVDVDQVQSGSALLDLDMKARREVFLRGAFRKVWKGTMLDLELFPQCHQTPTQRTG